MTTATTDTAETDAVVPKLTKAQTRALEIIGDGRKSGGFWHDLGISYQTLTALYDMDMLQMEMNGNSKPSKWVYWKA
jgi:hypothetical protein